MLEIEYKNGKVYRYYDVEPDTWEEYKDTVLSGGSSGVYVNFNIKPNYEYEELTWGLLNHSRLPAQESLSL